MTRGRRSNSGRRARAALSAVLALFVGAWIAAGLPRVAPPTQVEGPAYPCADHACGCTYETCSYEAGCCCYGPDVLAAFARPQREPDREPTLREAGCRRDGPAPMATVTVLSTVPRTDGSTPERPRVRRVDRALPAPRGTAPSPEIPPPRAGRLA